MELSHWDLVKNLTLWEAAFLAGGIEPRLKTLSPEQEAKAQLIHEKLAEDYELTLHCAKSILSGDRDPDESEESILILDALPSLQLLREVRSCLATGNQFNPESFENGERQTFTREQLQEWFVFSDFIPAYRFCKLKEKSAPTIQEVRQKNHSNVSDKLSKMNQASSKFWSNADRLDRSTHPTNATVTAWLVQRGFTQTLAEKGATLIRPEWVPPGRKPEE